MCDLGNLRFFLSRKLRLGGFRTWRAAFSYRVAVGPRVGETAQNIAQRITSELFLRKVCAVFGVPRAESREAWPPKAPAQS